MKVDLTLERDVQRAVVHVLETFGCRVISLRSLHSAKKGRPKQMRGVPDLKVYQRQQRRTFWFEVKRSGEQLSEDQEAFRRIAQECGETYVWGGVHEAQEHLKAIGLLVG
jgi:hypothetical protein